MKNKRLLTLDDLYNFYVNQNQSYTFSASDSGDTMIVHIEEIMSFEDDYDPTFGLLKTHLKSCHLYKNRNKSSISEEAMTQAIPSFFNRPILGKIHKLEDGSYDFAGHEMHINEDGELEFEEIPVGVIPESCNAQLVYDEEQDKTYLEVDGYIYEEYTRAANILREKKECKVSVEISVDEMSYSAQDKVLNIDKFHFLGVTILGCTDDEYETKIEEGMAGSNIKIAEFSSDGATNITGNIDSNSTISINQFNAENNSTFANIESSSSAMNSMFKMLEEINTKISNLNINNQNFEEGGRTSLKLNELLEKYGKTVEELEFEYENLSDEELETKFAEVFEEADTVVVDEGTVVEPVIETEPEQEVFDVEGEGEKEPETEEEAPVIETEANKKKKCSVEFNDKEYVFEISLDEKIYALERLVNETYADADDAYYCVKVYDKYLVMISWWAGAYRQSYKEEDGNYSLTGDRVEVFSTYLTKEEQAVIDELHANYSSVKTKLEEYEKKELNEQRKAVINSEDYSLIADTDEFKSLCNSMENYSVEDLSKEADLILARYVKSNKKFSFEGNGEVKEPKRNYGVFFSSSNNIDKEENKNAAYGGIFEDFYNRNK